MKKILIAVMVLVLACPAYGSFARSGSNAVIPVETGQTGKKHVKAHIKPARRKSRKKLKKPKSFKRPKSNQHGHKILK